MLRIVLAAALCLSTAPGPMPAVAHPRAVPQSDDCRGKTGARKKKSGLGKFLGGLAGGAVADRGGALGLDYGSRETLRQGIADSIACSLSPEEKKQAEDATMKAVAQPVGTSVRWESESRPGVSGSSTVTSQTRLADGTECKDVRKVATIDGEEKFIVEKLCRAPGSSGFVKQEAA